MTTRYSREQLLEAVRRNIVTLSDPVTDIQANVADQRLHGFIDGLLINIFLQNAEGKTVSRSQAWKMVPADHLDTCKKYVAEAERLGFISLEDDPSDGRRKNVIPTPVLIERIEARARTILDTAASILQGNALPAKSKLTAR